MIETFPSLCMFFKNQSGDHLPQQGWSKWGEPVFGLLKEELDEWYCQSCGEKQIRVLPSYMIPMDELQRDYIRVCAECKAQANGTRISFSYELIKIIKR